VPHLHRFYVPRLDATDTIVALTLEDAHHATRVLRLSAGTKVELFDGQGRVAQGTLAHVTRNAANAAVSEIQETPPPSRHLILGQAWLNHPKNIEAIISRGTELGVDTFVFFRGGHSERAPKQSDKWMRCAVESCKQCGRNRLPSFEIVENIEDCLARDVERTVIATVEGDPVAIGQAVGADGDVLLLVGPEGDFTPDEIAAAERAGASPISLGPTTLRSEIAATVAVALAQHAMGNLGPRA
jgi:16S rRNA (uracil1498-N3)-methyltransferase